MKFIIKLHPEIMIKSKSVRKRFTKVLLGNIRLVFKRNHLSVEVRHSWDKLLLLVNPASMDKEEQIVDLLQRIPGIDQILLVQESHFSDLDDVYQQIKLVWQAQLPGKTFVVRVKRRGEHSFSSLEAARYIGGRLNQECDTAGVRMKDPDLCIDFELNDDTLIQSSRRVKCLGGLPLPTQEDVLSLMSGGYDSGVASYHMIRRGARTHFCFFNLGGREHEIGVKQVSYYLWKRYSQSHKVKFIAVDFAPVVGEILEKIDNSQMGVVLKRMMLRAASLLADKLEINALVTGECLGQVSSQTLSNLHVIDQATDKLVLRPLICVDKLEIIDLAKHIGTEEFAKVMPEYCGVISNKPTVKALLTKVVQEETKFDFSLIEQAVNAAQMRDIRTIAEEAEQEVSTVLSVDTLTADSVVIDVRAPEEQELKPLVLTNIENVHIPFYKLATQFVNLAPNKQYYLYCERGVMSQLQALLLHEQGYVNVQVYRP